MGCELIPAWLHLDQHLAWDEGIGEPHPTSGPTLGDPVLEAHAGLGGGEELLHKGLAFLLLVAAAAGDPLGEGVECLLICHGRPGPCRCCHQQGLGPAAGGHGLRRSCLA